MNVNPVLWGELEKICLRGRGVSEFLQKYTAQTQAYAV